MGHGRIELKTRDQILQMRRAGLIVADIHAALRRAAQPGVTLTDLDRISAEVISQAGATSNFLNYFGYPATVCISVNDTVVHGIPNDDVLRNGDIVSFDCGAYVTHHGRGWHGDAAFSMIVGDEQAASQRRRELNEVTRAAMWRAIAALASARRVSAVGQAVEDTCEDYRDKFGWEAQIVEEFGGHGIGTAMHQPPDVLNYRATGISPRLKPGMVLAVEPILVSGNPATRTEADGWTVHTLDHSDAAHWEHSVAIMEEGISVLTAPDSGVEGLAHYGVTPISLD